jgi:hypothetical protein
MRSTPSSLAAAIRSTSAANSWAVDDIQRDYIARITGDAPGTLDPWYPEADGYVYAIAEDLAGSVYAGGYFANVGGAARSNITKLSPAGTGVADVAWYPGANSAVLSLTLDTNGVLYAGGAFTKIGGLARGGVAAFAVDEIFENGSD